MGYEYEIGKCPICDLKKPLPPEYFSRYEYSVNFADKEITKCCVFCPRRFRVLKKDLKSESLKIEIRDNPEILRWSLHKRIWKPTLKEAKDVFINHEKLDKLKEKYKIHYY
jgi:hypothetical protein